LVCEQNRLKIVVGVIVPGRGCAIRNRPGIFVRVSYYSRWIHKIMMTYRKPWKTQQFPFKERLWTAWNWCVM